MIIRTALAACVLLASTYGASAHEPGECRSEYKGLRAAAQSLRNKDAKGSMESMEIVLKGMGAFMNAGLDYARCTEGHETLEDLAKDLLGQ